MIKNVRAAKSAPTFITVLAADNAITTNFIVNSIHTIQNNIK